MSQPGQLSRPRLGSGWITRPLFGFFLAAAAIALLFYSPVWFASVTVLMTLFAAREWHRMVRPPQLRAAADHAALHVQTAITGLAIALGGARQLPKEDVNHLERTLRTRGLKLPGAPGAASGLIELMFD